MSNFDPNQAYDDFATLTSSFPSNPKPSEAIKMHSKIIDFFQHLHNASYEQGYKDCLDKNFKENDNSM